MPSIKASSKQADGTYNPVGWGSHLGQCDHIGIWGWHTFLGYYDSSGTKYYNSDGSSAKNWDKESDATLYAHWQYHSGCYYCGYQICVSVP